MRKNAIRITTALAGLATALSSAACGIDANPSMVIKAFHGLTVGTDGCTYSERPVVGGTFDAGLSAAGGGGYSVYVRIDNLMPGNENEDEGRQNTTFVQLTSFEVKYANAGAWAFLPSGKTLPAGFVMESSSENYVPVDPIDPQIAKLMLEGKDGIPSPIAEPGSCADLLLTFQANGMMGDGSEIESNEIDFPVTICNQAIGCALGTHPVGCSFVQPDGYTCEEDAAG